MALTVCRKSKRNLKGRVSDTSRSERIEHAPRDANIVDLQDREDRPRVRTGKRMGRKAVEGGRKSAGLCCLPPHHPPYVPLPTVAQPSRPQQSPAGNTRGPDAPPNSKRGARFTYETAEDWAQVKFSTSGIRGKFGKAL